MGLNAVVYARQAGVFSEGGPGRADINTAELHSDEAPVIDKRLGNASMIASIANEVLPFVEKDSILASKVLYSGSHSGDTIAVGDLDRLESEIHAIRKKASASLSSALDTFLGDMNEVITRARAEDSPIIFV